MFQTNKFLKLFFYLMHTYQRCIKNNEKIRTKLLFYALIKCRLGHHKKKNLLLGVHKSSLSLSQAQGISLHKSPPFIHSTYHSPHQWVFSQTLVHWINTLPFVHLLNNSTVIHAFHMPKSPKTLSLLFLLNQTYDFIFSSYLSFFLSIFLFLGFFSLRFIFYFFFFSLFFNYYR